MTTCLFPWTHLHYHTDGQVYPCCKLVGNSDYKLGSSSASLDTIWNSKPLREMRLQIKAGSLPPICKQHCIDGAQPINQFIAERYLERQQDYFEATASDGSYPENLVIWNINESNKCNFKCIYCNAEYSTQYGPLQKSFNSESAMLDLVEQNIDKIEVIYFAAGETHLQPGYYKILDLLLKHNRQNVDIEFITNMSGYTLAGRNVFELLNQFTNATVVGSIDTSPPFIEKIRRGINWKQVEQTRAELQKYSNVNYINQAVVSKLNILSLPDFHKDWYQKGFIRKDNMRFFCLTDPSELSITQLSATEKLSALQKLSEYKQFLKEEQSTFCNKMTPIEKLKQIIALMWQPAMV